VVESTATEIVLGKNLKQFTIDLNDLVDDIGPLLNKRSKKSTVANGRDFDKFVELLYLMCLIGSFLVPFGLSFSLLFYSISQDPTQKTPFIIKELHSPKCHVE
jgi:hypothetical protein